MQQSELNINNKKCSFGQYKLKYMGHAIFARGLSTDPKKLEAMILWPSPNNVTNLKGILGLTNYYRRFVHDCGRIARPLTREIKFCL